MSEDFRQCYKAVHDTYGPAQAHLWVDFITAVASEYAGREDDAFALLQQHTFLARYLASPLEHLEARFLSRAETFEDLQALLFKLDTGHENALRRENIADYEWE